MLEARRDAELQDVDEASSPRDREIGDSERISRDHVRRTLPLALLPPKILPRPEDDQALVLEQMEAPLSTGPPLLRARPMAARSPLAKRDRPRILLLLGDRTTLGTAHAWISS